MYRGTTPTIVFCLHTDIDLTSMEQVYITFKTEDFEQTFDNTKITNDNNHLYLNLTQEETLAFPEGKIECQIRILADGKASASPIRTLNVKKILKEGIINA